MYANFRDKGYKSKALKNDLQAVAYAYIKFNFNIAMKKLKMQSKSTYNYMASIKKETQARHTISLSKNILL